MEQTDEQLDRLARGELRDEPEVMEARARRLPIEQQRTAARVALARLERGL